MITDSVLYNVIEFGSQILSKIGEIGMDVFVNPISVLIEKYGLDPFAFRLFHIPTDKPIMYYVLITMLSAWFIGLLVKFILVSILKLI